MRFQDRLFSVSTFPPRSMKMLLLVTMLGGAGLAQNTADKAPAAAKETVSSTAANAPAAPAASGVPAAVPLQAAPANFDVQGRSRQVLAHLNAVIRYYRSSLTPIQKTGEPSDALYREEGIADAKEVANYAFQSAKAEAGLLAAYQKHQGTQEKPPAESEAEKLHAAQANVAQRIVDLKAQLALLQTHPAKARGKQGPSVQVQEQEIQSQLELSDAMSDALGKIVNMSDTQGRTGLAADIERLQRTAPELTDTKTKMVSAPLVSFSSASSAGVTDQASVLYQLLTTRRDIDAEVRETDELHAQALSLRTPLTNVVRSLMQKGQALAQQPSGAVAASSATQPLQQATPQDFQSVAATFKVISAAAVPLSQEIITLEQSRSNLMAWRAAVEAEYRIVLRLLVSRILVIAIALGVLLAIGEVWRRVTTRYVHDARRRRQLLGMRRLVIGFLSVLVVLFGFVTQFNSLATFAGFITAGLAVGLQTILLSVAAYFFIVGRYGVRVGDRISVGGVTGDVIEVGLVRFYVMELAGSGTELQPTGRVAVLSNAILFQAATPLYKQLPGTEYAWHEMTAKLLDTAEYRRAAAAILQLVQKVYEGYRARIEQQQRNVEGWMDVRIAAPIVESRLQLVDGGLQLLVRFPVEIREASQIDEQITEAMLQLMHEDEGVKQAISSPPMIKAAVKG